MLVGAVCLQKLRTTRSYPSDASHRIVQKLAFEGQSKYIRGWKSVALSAYFEKEDMSGSGKDNTGGHKEKSAA